MAQTDITIWIDEDIKKQAEELFDEFGMSMTTALTIFIKTVVRQGKIPFEISTDIPNAETIEAMKEAERIADDDSVKGYYDVDEMFKDILNTDDNESDDNFDNYSEEIPNAETIEAIKDVEDNKNMSKTFDSVEKLTKALDLDDDD